MTEPDVACKSFVGYGRPAMRVVDVAGVT